MRNWAIGRQFILVLHRWTGAIAAAFLLLLALTGMALNHADRIGLHDVTLRLPFVLDRYNMATAEDIRSLRLSSSLTVSELDSTLYVNGRYSEDISGRLIDARSGIPVSVVVLDTGLMLLTESGELIESLPVESLPFSSIAALGRRSDGGAVLVTDTGNWSADSDWLDFNQYTGSYTVESPDWIILGNQSEKAILEHYNGKGPSLYRVLLDLHSGRLFGWQGRSIMDLAAIAIIVLVVSGIVGWLKRSRGPTRRIR